MVENPKAAEEIRALLVDRRKAENAKLGAPQAGGSRRLIPSDGRWEGSANATERQTKDIALTRHQSESGLMKNLLASSGISFSPVGAVARGSILALLVALAGCGGDDDDELNMGKFCSTIGGAFCDRLINCGTAQSSQKTACVDAFVEGCCKDDGRCNEKPENATAEVALKRFMDECSAALKTHACDQLQSALPAACTSTGARLVSPNQTPAHPVPATLDRPGDSNHPYNMGRTAGRALHGR